MIKPAQMKRLQEILDEDCIRILKILRKGEITDQKIAERMRIRANTIRRILNEMHTKGIITYRKEKERSGWYNYIWRVNPEMIDKFTDLENDRYIGFLEKRLSHEAENQFFQCSDGCTRLEYAHALNSDFKCPLCSKHVKPYDNKKEISGIKRDIKVRKQWIPTKPSRK